MSEVTLFPRANITTGGQDVAITDILKAIKEKRWEEKVSEVREAVYEFGSKKATEVGLLKRNLPYFTGSGTFTKRCEDGIKKHSGFIVVDIDDLDEQLPYVKDKLTRDPFVFSVFTSVSGTGLAVLLRVVPDQHEKAFREAETYFKSEYGITIDYLPDLSRARFISSDSTLYLNEDAKVFDVQTFFQSDEIQTRGDLPNGQNTHEDFINLAIEEVSKRYEYKEGQRHNFIVRVACHCNRHAIPQEEVERVIKARFPHFAQNPSNAISGPYRQYKNERGKYLEQPKSLDIKEAVADDMTKALEITFDFEPQIKMPVLRINDVRVCSIGNIFSLIAAPGTGKSQTCEAIAAGFINPDCDSLGITTELPEDKVLVYIDGERTHEDCKNGFLRIGRRADLDNNPGIQDGNRLKDFRYQSFIGIPTVEVRRAELDRIIESENIGLLIIDDISCIVKDTNDNIEAEEVLMYLIAKANTKGFGIVLTVHPNPGSEKPRGHIGSATLRLSEAVYALKRAADNKAIRRLTTDTTHAKTRNATDINEVNFEWSETARMFMSTDYDPTAVVKSEGINYSVRFGELFEAIGAPKVQAKRLYTRYIEVYGVGESTAMRHVRNAVEMGHLQKGKEGKNVYFQYIRYENGYEDVPF